MKLGRSFSILLVLITVASCISRADVPVTVVDERTPSVRPIVPSHPEQDLESIVSTSADVASFTVTATARAKATSALLHTRFTSREPSQPAVPTAQITLADAAPIIAALLRRGIPQRRITMHQQMSAPNHQSAIPGAVDIDVALRNTDPQYIRSLGKTINDAAGYPVYHAFSDVTFHADNCASLLERARKAAFDEARTEATRAVPGPHPRLGPIVNVREFSLSVTEGTCGDVNTTAGSTLVYRNGEDEITNGGYVIASSRLSVSFRLLP